MHRWIVSIMMFACFVQFWGSLRATEQVQGMRRFANKAQPLPPVRGGNSGWQDSSEDENIRVWTAACLACHVSYGAVADGGAQEALRLARRDGIPLANWLHIVDEQEQWCLFSGEGSGSGETLLLAWRGTVLHRLEDLVADFHCCQASAGNGLCDGGLHAGFLERAATFDYRTLASRCSAPGVRRVVLCGHSLGGAVAFIATAMLARHDTQQLPTRPF
jgi:hypothetical protein